MLDKQMYIILYVTLFIVTPFSDHIYSLRLGAIMFHAEWHMMRVFLYPPTLWASSVWETRQTDLAYKPYAYAYAM